MRIDAQNGYVVDTPNVVFQRCDGRVFAYDEVSTANTTSTKNNLAITGGWSNYPLAYIDTDATSEITFASSQFTMEMFEMANAANAVEKETGVRESKRYEVETGLMINLPFEIQEKSVAISGLTEGTTAAAGTYKVEITKAAASTAGETTITFAEGDVVVGDTIRVAYKRRIHGAAVVSELANSGTVKGELTLTWPVYSSGIDCTESSIKGYLHRVFYRVRATALPGFDNSYKAAATNSVTFAAIDPKRADGKIGDWIYEQLDSDGQIINKGEGTVEW